MNRTSVYAGLACAALAGAFVGAKGWQHRKRRSISARLSGELPSRRRASARARRRPLSTRRRRRATRCVPGCRPRSMPAALSTTAPREARARSRSPRSSCAAVTALEGNLPADCTAVLTETVAPGGQCSSQFINYCAGGYCNAHIPMCGGPVVYGQCVAWPTEGEPCPDGFCAPGLSCGARPPGSGFICVVPSGAGGPCPCQAGLYCDRALTCKAMKTSGSCSGPFECAQGYVCSGSPGSCVPYVGLGASCGATAVCGMGYYCDSGTGKCAALPVVGQPCLLTRAGTTSRLQCVASWCDADGTKICQPRKADGEPCTSPCMFQPCTLDEQCVGYCDTSTQTCAGAGQGIVCVTP